MSFDKLGLSEAVVKAVTDSGYTEPTPIQKEAIPHALEGRDILGLAQTGTGKTASFTLPMIDRLSKGRAKARMPRGLVIAPTRELAMQVAEQFEKYTKHTKRLSHALLIGGVSFKDQEEKLTRGVEVLIATPGRLLDHFERGKVLLQGVEVLVVDEADRMLDMGFIPDIERIFKLTPFTRQTLFFSATMPPEIERLTAQFLHNPVQVEVAKQSSTAETVDQHVIRVRRDDKREALRRLIRERNVKNAIVFCNRKTDVSILYKSLTKHEFSVGALHGDLDQHIRMKVLDAFRKDQLQILVASDVAARGLDIPNVSHVFNFDVPIHSEDYVHRIGRTGRAGREGTAFMLATPSETKYLAQIEALIGKPIPMMDLEGLSLDEGEADDSEKSGRGGRGSKGRDDKRSRRGGRSRKDNSETAEAPKDEVKASGETADKAQAKEAKPAKEVDQSAEKTADQAPAKAKDDKPEPKKRGRRRKDEAQPAAKSSGKGSGKSSGKSALPKGANAAFGDNPPAFLLREVPLPSKRKSDDEDAAEAA